MNADKLKPNPKTTIYDHVPLSRMSVERTWVSESLFPLGGLWYPCDKRIRLTRITSPFSLWLYKINETKDVVSEAGDKNKA